MNIGLVYKHRPGWPKFQWVHNAFLALGHHCTHVTTADELRQADGDCDLILFEQRDPPLGRKVATEIGQTRRAVWMQWWFDLLFCQTHQPLLDLYGPLLRTMDLVLVKELWQIGAYRSLGITAEYLDQGCPDEWPACEHPDDPEFDVLVFGSLMPHYRQRRDDVEALVRAGFRVAWAGNNGAHPPGVVPLPWCHPSELPALMSRAALALCVDLRHDVPGYWSDRLWLSLGAGACVLKRDTKGQPDLPMSVYCDELLIGSCVSDLRSPIHRRQIGAEARRITLLGHTYTHRCQEIVNHAERFLNGGRRRQPEVCLSAV